MDESISPRFLMSLIAEINSKIWAEFSSYKNAQFYIERWHKSDREGFNYWENFSIIIKENGDIDLLKTLHSLDGETLLKIAIDLGIETPDFIPSVPTFKNNLRENFVTAYDSFQKAVKQIEEHPDLAIGLANSTLESIIKKILFDERVGIPFDKTKTLFKLTEDILKAFQMFPGQPIPEEIRNISSALLKASQGIERLRS